MGAYHVLLGHPDSMTHPLLKINTLGDGTGCCIGGVPDSKLGRDLNGIKEF